MEGYLYIVLIGSTVFFVEDSHQRGNLLLQSLVLFLKPTPQAPYHCSNIIRIDTFTAPNNLIGQ